MGSTRLPGKVLMDLGGQTVLARGVRRLRRASLIQQVVIATTDSPEDDAIVHECNRLGVVHFRGSEEDVLDRYYRTAEATGADAVVRVTSDCPLIDPEISDKVIRAFLERQPDYASNTLRRTYPRGLDTEVMTWDALARTWREARKPYQRTHVTAYIYENPNRFDLLAVTGESDHSDCRWTVDTPEDLSFVRAVYERMGSCDDFSWREALALLDREPALVELNRHIAQKAVHEG
jgi:spore coat polysaccharide biosynthesis protein SpsF